MGLLRERVDACMVPPQARIDRPVDKRRASHPLPQAAFKSASLLRQPRLAQALDLPIVGVENARIAVRVGELRLVRLPRRDRPESRARRQSEEMLQRFPGLRLITGQSQRRSEGCIWKRVARPDCDRPARPVDRMIVLLQPEIRIRLPKIHQMLDRAD